MTLRQQLSQLDLPTEPVKLQPGVTVLDARKFIAAHLEMVENSDYDEYRIAPYRERLELFINHCLTNKAKS